MKKLFGIISLQLVITISIAQSKIEWQKSFGGTQDDYPDYVSSEVLTSDGGYFFAGTSKSTDGDVTGLHGNEDFWVFKLNASGVLQWQKTYGGSQDEYASAFAQTKDNGFIVVGSTYSTDGNVSGNHGDYDIWVLKIGSLGAIQWTKCFGGSDADYAYGVIQTLDGGYAIVGKTWSSDGNVTGYKGNGDAWMIKISSTGAFQWQKTYGGPGEDNAWQIKQSDDGSYVVCGTTESTTGDVSGNHGGFDAWVFKLDGSGNVIWKKCYGGTGDDYAYSLSTTSDGSYIVSAETNSSNGDVNKNQGGYDIWILKCNQNGNLIWQKTFGGSDDDWACSVRSTADDGFIIGGSTFSNDGDLAGNHGAWDYVVLKISPSGAIQWKKLMGGTLDDEISVLQQTKDGGYIICGYSYSNNGDVSGNHGESDFWIVKLNPTSTQVGDEWKNEDFILFPNPVTSYLYFKKFPEMLRYRGSVEIYNNTGQRMLEQEYDQLDYIELNVNDLMSGIFRLKIENEFGSFTVPFIKVDQ